MTTTTHHYREEDGISGYKEGDILVNDTTGERSRVVRDGRGLVLVPDVSAQHTPGPWHREHDDSAIVGDGPLARSIARVYFTHPKQGDDPEARANARLIAEAPAMRAEIQETELNLVQMLLAVNIGKKTKQRQIDFMRGVVERVIDRNRALLARIDGTEHHPSALGNYGLTPEKEE